jgi:hypothetical protein
VSLQVDQWLQERRPAADLAGVLRCVWRGDLRDFRTPLLDECLDLTWIDDGTLWLSGPESKSCHPRSRQAQPLWVSVSSPAWVRPSWGWRHRRCATYGSAWTTSGATPLHVSWPNGWHFSPTTGDERGSWSAPCAVWPSTLAPSARSIVRWRTGSRGRGRLRCASLPGPLGCPSASSFAVVPPCSATARPGWPGSGGCSGLHLARSSPRTLRLVDLATGAGYVDQQHLAHEIQAIMGTTPTLLLRPSAV